jgi:hypothetical protein
METEQNQLPKDTEKLKEIPKWARRYAENRTVPQIIFHLIFLSFVGVVFLSVYCFLQRWFILASILMGIYVVGFICLLIFDDRFLDWYFERSGVPESSGVQQIKKVMPLPLITCVVISVIIEQQGVFPGHLRMPISAVYLCPILIFANWRWVKDSFTGYLWAALYGAWAVAIVFKVPILTFPDRSAGYEMIAVPVTGLITGLVSYIYSRYALKKLKGISHLEGDAANEV